MKNGRLAKKKCGGAKKYGKKKCEKRMADQEFKKCGEERFQKVKEEWYISNKKMR